MKKRLLNIKKLWVCVFIKNIWTYIFPSKPANLIVYKGFVSFTSANNLPCGTTVCTPEGVGTILESNNGIIRVLLYNGRSKPFYSKEVGRWVVENDKLRMPFLIATAHYRYIYKSWQEIEYRISLSDYALLTDACRARYTYAKKINKMRNGYQILRLINELGYKIIEENAYKERNKRELPKI